MIAAAAVGLAVLGGISSGLLVSADDSGGDSGGDSTVQSQEAVDTETLQDESRLDERRVPLVAELTNLTVGEAWVLAVAAQARDQRTDARQGKEEDGVREPSQSLLPIDTDDRYRYFRRVGAVAVVLAELGDIADRTRPFATADGVAAQVRPHLDRLLVIIARLNLGPYLRSRRLSELVTRVTLRLGTLAAGDLRPESAAELRTVSERLGVLGGAIAADLESAAALASRRDYPASGRLLAGVDRKLGELAALQ